MKCEKCGNEIENNNDCCEFCANDDNFINSQNISICVEYDEKSNKCGHCNLDDEKCQCNPDFNKEDVTECNDMQRMSKNLVGFSEKINSPEILMYKMKANTWALSFAFMLAVVSMFAVPVYGSATNQVAWPNSLYLGAALGGVFVCIGILQVLRQRSDKSWDGTIINKEQFAFRHSESDGSYHEHIIYKLVIKKDKVGTKTHKSRDIKGIFDYYNIGDRVRHHKGFEYYEKFDKSKDMQIMCVACLSFHDISSDICSKCKCPLLK